MYNILITKQEIVLTARKAIFFYDFIRDMPDLNKKR